MSIEDEQKWWAELSELSEDPDIRKFYAKYAEYLESRNVLSGNRTILHKMAKRVSEIK